MKELLIILLIAFSTDSFGQETDIQKRIKQNKKGDYIQTPAIDDFEGSWRSKDNGVELKLVLIKKPKLQIGSSEHPLFIDFLVGRCMLKKNGKELVNTIREIEKPSTFTGTLINSKEADLSIRLTGSEISTRASLILQSDKRKAIWKLKRKITKEELLRYPNSLYEIPNEIMLYKE